MDVRPSSVTPITSDWPGSTARTVAGLRTADRPTTASGGTDSAAPSGSSGSPGSSASSGSSGSPAPSSAVADPAAQQRELQRAVQAQAGSTAAVVLALIAAL